jgi:hypothetical protein
MLEAKGEEVQIATKLQSDLILVGHKKGSLSSYKNNEFCEELNIPIFNKMSLPVR